MPLGDIQGRHCPGGGTYERKFGLHRLHHGDGLAGSDQVAGNDAAFQSLYFIGALLFVMTLILNVLGDKLVNRVREAY